MKPSAKENGPNPIDLHVGARVRLRRKYLGMSQEGLADSIDLTFQQVQKYERGSNRISASKLYEIAKVLKVREQYFFDGYEDEGVAETDDGTGLSQERQVNAFLATAEGIELAESFPKIRRRTLRQRIVQLVTTISKEDSAGADDAA